MKRVVIFENVSKELRSRSVARKMFSELAAQGLNVNFELDFNNIIMMSRSFADEVLEFIDLIGKTKVCIINANENISLTLKIVDKNRNNRRYFKATGQSKSFDNIDSLKDYLLSF